MNVILDAWVDLPTHPTKEPNPVTNICDLDILEPEEKIDCDNNMFFSYRQFERAIIANPDVRFAIINGAVDKTQAGFYGVGDEEFYKHQTLLLNRDLQHPNFYVFIVKTAQHSFFIRSNFSGITPTSSITSFGSARPLLSTWVAEFLVGPPQPRIVCDGQQRQVALTTDVTGWGYEYCGLQTPCFPESTAHHISSQLVKFTGLLVLIQQMVGTL